MLHSKATEEPASYLQRVEKPQDFAPMTVAQSESLDGFFHRPPHAAQHACTRTFQRVCSVYHKHDQCPMILCAGILRGPFTSTFTSTFTFPPSLPPSLPPFLSATALTFVQHPANQSNRSILTLNFDMCHSLSWHLTAIHMHLAEAKAGAQGTVYLGIAGFVAACGYFIVKELMPG